MVPRLGASMTHGERTGQLAGDLCKRGQHSEAARKSDPSESRPSVGLRLPGCGWRYLGEAKRLQPRGNHPGGRRNYPTPSPPSSVPTRNSSR